MTGKLTATEIRDAVLPLLRDHYELPYETMLIYEMVTGDWSRVKTGRADVALILDDRSIGIELKAETDTLKRLDTQIADYESAFDECWLVSHERLFHKAVEAMPEHWGLVMAWRVNGETRLRVGRQAGMNPNATAEAALHRIWAKDVRALAKRKELWFGRYPECGIGTYGKYQTMKLWLDAVTDPEHLAEIRAAAVAAYKARRALGNTDRTANKYGPTMTIGSEIDRIEKWS